MLQILRALWNEFVRNWADRTNIQSVSVQENSHSDSIEKIPNGAFTLRKFIECMQQSLFISGSRNGIVVCLDHFDSLERMDIEVASKLLLLGEVKLSV